MKVLIFNLFVFVIISISSCSQQSKTTADYKTVPLPQKIEMLDGREFILKQSTRISYTENQNDLKFLAELLSEYVEQKCGYRLETTTQRDSNNNILLTTDFENENKESYQLSINENNITLAGASPAGVLYGIQTLRKSIPIEPHSSIIFPKAKITDYPAYEHRGAMLDVSRHFSDIEFVKKYIDILAMCNMNVFHWHLTDDQGWRIEIKKYPKLAEIGAYRDSTIIERHTNTFEKKRHGGYYTQDEIKEIVSYAQQRYITVIPEVDLPGHMLAALSSYPELGCTGGPYHVGSEWGVYEDVLCAGNEKVFTFLNDIFNEISELFPAKYIHIGGDECPKNRWLACDRCKAKIKELGIKDDKEHTAGEQLQSYLIARVEKMLNQKGKSVIGWDEILEGGIAPNATIMSWRGTKGDTYAATKGHDVIMTPESHLYLDYYQSPNVDDTEPYTFGWLTDLRKVYSFDPMPSDLAEDKRQHILGAQVNLWCEYIPTSKNVEYMLLPRIFALAETVWTNPKKKDYNEFVCRLSNISDYLDFLGYENCKQAYAVQDSSIIDTTNGDIKLYLSTFNHRNVSYTIDNNVEYNVMPANTEPIIINRPTSVSINDGKHKKVINYLFNKATAKPITLKYAPDSRYTFAGAEMLIDGQLGTRRSYRTGTWIGFSGVDCEALIDMKESTEINQIAFNYYFNTRGGLFPPKSLTISVSTDNKIFETVFHQEYTNIANHALPCIKSLDTTLKQTNTARFIKINIGSIRTLPSWHEKKNDKALLMLDEIIIN